MKLVCKTIDEMTPRQVYEVLRARNEIFVVEQDCVYQDCDGFDYGLHVFYEDAGGKVAAYMRIYEVNDSHMADFGGEGARKIRYRLREGMRTVQMGRVLTIDHGEGLGGRLLREGIRIARDVMKADIIYLEAETYVVGFYEKEKFERCSPEFLKDGIPHVQMELKLR